VAGDICELFKLCSTKQLDTAKDFLSKIDRLPKKKQNYHGDKSDHKVDSGNDKKSSVTIAMEQLTVNDKSLTIDDQCSNSHHGNSESTIKDSTLGMDNEGAVTNSDHNVLHDDDDDDGWEVVKRKKR